ncbi:hypothetical protein N1851_030193 [Merluccius polli]|uniref:Apolipoprotein M n=1 Tax=Merluccius polli TaxID=89951 RepID=A0AA47NS06_MERPO|nr:hypothetical protein N1851_030193 [Merluccius polli]
MAPQLILAALALVCLGVASQPDCSDLVKPLTDYSSSLGKWIFYAGTSNTEESLAKLKTFTSSWIRSKRVSDGRPEVMEFADKVNGKCVYVDANITTVDDRIFIAFNYQNQTHVHNGQHLETCPDCLLWTDTTKTPGSVDTKNLYIFTRTGNLTLPHLELVKQQAACLNFTLGFHRGSADLCPEQKEESAEKEDE